MTTPPEDATPPTPIPSEQPEPPADKTLTQVEVDRIVADRVKRAEAKYADYGDLKAKASKLDDLEEANATELDKAKRDAEQATTRLNEYERTNLRQRIALEKGLPASLVGRLQGATEDEVSADADALMALIKSPATPRPDPSQGARPTSAEEEAAAEYERFYPTPTRK